MAARIASERPTSVSENVRGRRPPPRARGHFGTLAGRSRPAGPLGGGAEPVPSRIRTRSAALAGVGSRSGYGRMHIAGSYPPARIGPRPGPSPPGGAPLRGIRNREPAAQDQPGLPLPSALDAASTPDGAALDAFLAQPLSPRPRARSTSR